MCGRHLLSGIEEPRNDLVTVTHRATVMHAGQYESGITKPQDLQSDVSGIGNQHRDDRKRGSSGDLMNRRSFLQTLNAAALASAATTSGLSKVNR